HFYAAPNIAFGIGKDFARFVRKQGRDFIMMFFQKMLIAKHQTRSL
ncbi:hypothetical protein D041_0802B, partial [Vibrio parahaemolyticus EKP-008]